MIRRDHSSRSRRRGTPNPAALALLTLVAWCGRESAAQPPRPADAKPGPTGGPPPAAKAATDDSLTTQEYLRLGLPAPDRDWMGGDMVKAQEVLAALSKQGCRQFPRYQSPHSGEVFAKLTSPQNLEFSRNRTLPLGSRFPETLRYYQATGQVFKMYLAGFVKGEVRDSEIVELFGSTLRVTVVMLELTDEFMPTLDKGDPSYQVRMQGLEQMRRGLANIVASGLQTLTERRNYRASELTRLVGYMQETFPPMVPHLPPGTRTETILRLEKMQQDPALKDLQPGLGELYEQVKAAAHRVTIPRRPAK